MGSVLLLCFQNNTPNFSCFLINSVFFTITWEKAEISMDKSRFWVGYFCSGAWSYMQQVGNLKDLVICLCGSYEKRIKILIWFWYDFNTNHTAAQQRALRPMKRHRIKTLIRFFKLFFNTKRTSRWLCYYTSDKSVCGNRCQKMTV